MSHAVVVVVVDVVVVVAVGVLCGSCSNGTGFSALLNKCVDCEASHISFLAAMGETKLMAVLYVVDPRRRGRCLEKVPGFHIRGGGGAGEASP